MSKKVYIGVGHGGADSGAVGNGFKEKDLNLDIAKSCKAALERSGVSVMISRESDISENLSARIKECNAFKPDLAVDIHNNAGGGDGAEVYHSARNSNDDIFAQNILDEIVKIGQNSRGKKTKVNKDGSDYFGFIRQIACPSVLLECAFVDNAKDIQIIDTPAEREKMGIAVAKGILKTLGMSYKEQSTPAVSFLPSRGYFQKGDVSPNVGKIADFMRKVFPSYTDKRALGNTYGPYLIKAITEFQRRTGLKPDGFTGPLTLDMLKRYGFRE